ncbi:protein HIRA homolog isoform X2 [Eurosta solidaginis]|uniref:protein HIRA homolog isoform X2 n=1 Tax=Eurosta solidaginis TaxID=178769 RepID=UPI00353131B8
MKLLKPSWVHHDDKPIFSIDVHQECLKFATGGQGLDSGRVVIWNLVPVLSEKVEQDESVPKLLCQLDNHLACVNCVRWSPNGQMLASGSDDKLVMIWRMSKNSLFQKTYGKSVTLENGTGGAADLLIENPELLADAHEKPKAPTLPTAITTNTISPNADVIPQCSMKIAETLNGYHNPAATYTVNSIGSEERTNNIGGLRKQTETRTADGKRRITPVFVAPNQDVGESKTTPDDNVSHSQLVTPLSSNTTATNAPAPSVPTADVSESDTNTLAKPMITEAQEICLDARLVKTTISAAKLHPQKADNSSVRTFPLIVATKSSTNATTAPTTKTTTTTNASFKPYQASTTGPKLVINHNTKCEFQKTALDHRVHVHNGYLSTGSGFLAKVTGYNMLRPAQIEKLWEILVGSPIVNLNFCYKYVMLCSLDGTLRLMDMKTGVATLPVISISTAAVQCAFCPSSRLVGVVSDCGTVRIWHIAERRIFLAATYNEIGSKLGTVVQFNITEDGVPMILFANGNAYSYSSQLQSWLALNTKDPIIRHGVQTTIPKDFQKNYVSYPLISTQAATNTFAAKSTSVDMNMHDWQSSAKLSFIENQIMLSEAINSPDELIFWYNMYAYQLAMSGTEQRLRLLLDDLLGPSPRNVSAAHKILSVPKHQLLASVLNILKTHIKWQRLYMEYHELFDYCSNIISTDTDDMDVDMSSANTNADTVTKNN